MSQVPNSTPSEKSGQRPLFDKCGGYRRLHIFYLCHHDAPEDHILLTIAQLLQFGIP